MPHPPHSATPAPAQPSTPLAQLAQKPELATVLQSRLTPSALRALSVLYPNAFISH
jgi:hypothetical protein